MTVCNALINKNLTNLDKERTIFIEDKKFK